MKGCLIILVVFVVVGVGEYFLLGYTPMSGSIGLPILSAALIAIAFGNVAGLLVWLRRRSAASKPPGAWRDGDLVGFSGRITSANGALLSPGSGASAALYEYSLKHRTETQYRNSDGSTRTESREVEAYSGMAMAGCTVQSGVYNFRLIGYPLLTDIPKQVLDTPQARERIAAHLLRVEVKPKPEGIGAAFSSLSDVLADADGVVALDQGSFAEFDLRPHKEAYQNDPAGAVAELTVFLMENDYWIEETVVQEAAEVTVFGHYRAADRSIDIGSGMKHAEHGLSLGSAAKVTGGGLRKTAISLVFFLGAAVGFHWWFGPALWASATKARYEGDGIPFSDAIGARFGNFASSMVRFAGHQDPQTMVLLLKLGANPNSVADGTSALQAARDTATMKLLLDAGANPDVADQGGSTPGATPLYHFAETDDLEAVQMLIAHGAHIDAVDSYGNTALARAAVYGRLEIGKALLQAKADPNHRAKDGSTPLDEARAEGHDDFAQMLLSGGARESEVSSNDGAAVALGDAPVRLITAYEEALRAHDAAKLGLLKPALAGYDWSSTDWNALLSGRPVRIEQAIGFANDERATIRVSGPTADGKPRGLVIGYGLKRVPAQASEGPLAPYAGWQIEREWIEWGELKRRG